MGDHFTARRALTVEEVFGERLSVLLKIHNHKHKDLAAHLNLAPGTISYYVNGRIPSAEILIAIADFYDVPLDYLVGRTNSAIRK